MPEHPVRLSYNSNVMQILRQVYKKDFLYEPIAVCLATLVTPI